MLQKLTTTSRNIFFMLIGLGLLTNVENKYKIIYGEAVLFIYQKPTFTLKLIVVCFPFRKGMLYTSSMIPSLLLFTATREA